jgi:hypothetical protein
MGPTLEVDWSRPPDPYPGRLAGATARLGQATGRLAALIPFPFSAGPFWGDALVPWFVGGRIKKLYSAYPGMTKRGGEAWDLLVGLR